MAYFLGMWPALPGFVEAVGGLEVGIVWRRFYQISYFFGFLVAGGLFWGFNLVSPVVRGSQVDFDLDGLDGQAVVGIDGGEKRGLESSVGKVVD